MKNELKPPHVERFKSMANLCLQKNPYDRDVFSNDNLFIDSMKESISWHVENSHFYKNWLEKIRI